MTENEFEVIRSVALTLRKKHLGDLYEASDLYAAGWKAVKEFHRKNPGSTDNRLLGAIVRRRMIDYARILNPNRSFNPTSLPDHEIVQAVMDDDSDNFDKIVKMFRPREQQILRLYFKADMCYLDVGEVMGLSESRVWQILNRDILPTLRETMSLTASK